MKQLSEAGLGFFAPDPNLLGRVLEPEWYKRGVIVYLSPQLLGKPDTSKVETIEGTIAHELAHVYLEHHLDPDPEQGTAALVGEADERRCDELAESWGFRVPRSLSTE